jgi:DNA replication initiation complex subunit (GINS family)
MRDVDQFLDEITAGVGDLLAENERLRRHAGAAPVVGSPDLDDVARQADEIIQRARDEAAAIVAAARERAASRASGGAGAGDPGAVNAFLLQEREFLQNLAGLVQGHAESVKAMAKVTRRPANPPERAATPERAAAPDREPSPPAETPKPPIVVDEPQHATATRTPTAKVGDVDADKPDDSLRDLFWGDES